MMWPQFVLQLQGLLHQLFRAGVVVHRWQDGEGRFTGERGFRWGVSWLTWGQRTMGHSTVAGNRESAVLTTTDRTGTTKNICSLFLPCVRCAELHFKNEKSRRELRLFGYASKRCLEHVFDRGGFVRAVPECFCGSFRGSSRSFRSPERFCTNRFCSRREAEDQSFGNAVGAVAGHAHRRPVIRAETPVTDVVDGSTDRQAAEETPRASMIAAPRLPASRPGRRSLFQTWSLIICLTLSPLEVQLR